MQTVFKIQKLLADIFVSVFNFTLYSKSHVVFKLTPERCSNTHIDVLSSEKKYPVGITDLHSPRFLFN